MSIGGTSGSGSSGNLSLNLNGLDLNYDLGPSISTIFQQGQSFLSSTFNADQNFVGGAIHGANTLVADLSAPLIGGALEQSQVNQEVLPSLFQQSMNDSLTLGEASINAQQQIADASIASSNASANDAANAGGGCYVTTAVCETLGLPDDCHTLRVLRTFRDTYLLKSNVGRAFVEEYYATAPALVSNIQTRGDAKEYSAGLYTRFILPALIAIEYGALSRAFKIYREMIYTVRAENAGV